MPRAYVSTPPRGHSLFPYSTGRNPAMTISTAPISPAFELPDEEAAMRALVRAAVLLTGAAAAIAAVLGVVHTVLAVAGADRAAAIAPAFAFAVGVWAGIQAVTVLM